MVSRPGVLHVADLGSGEVLTTEQTNETTYTLGVKPGTSTVLLGRLDSLLIVDVVSGQRRQVGIPDCLIISVAVPAGSSVATGACSGGDIVSVDVDRGTVTDRRSVGDGGGAAAIALLGTETLVVGTQEGRIYEYQPGKDSVEFERSNAQMVSAPTSLLTTSSDGTRLMHQEQGNAGYEIGTRGEGGGSFEWMKLAMDLRERTTPRAGLIAGSCAIIGLGGGMIQGVRLESGEDLPRVGTSVGLARAMWLSADGSAAIIVGRDGGIASVPLTDVCPTGEAIRSRLQRSITTAEELAGRV